MTDNARAKLDQGLSTLAALDAPNNGGRPTAAYAVILVLFFLSGISGLLYETVWLRMAIRILGSTVYATSIVTAAYMAGLALGSLVLGRIILRVKNPLRLYAFLEVGVGLTALILTWSFNHLTPLFRTLYHLGGQTRFLLTLIQAVATFLLMLVPAALMGGTLPALVAATRRSSAAFSSRAGLLYGLNTFGAFLGVLWAGYWAIGAIGEKATVIVGAVLNILVALTASMLALRESPAGAAVETQYSRSKDRGINRMLLAMFAVSGFAALGYEIIWNRIFQIQLGTSVYAFSMILAVYLLGVGIGSIVGSRLATRIRNPLAAWGAAQIFIALYACAGMYIFPAFIQTSFYGPFLTTNLVLIPLTVVFPAALAMGFSFPLSAQSYGAAGKDEAMAVGRIYAWNTAGCITGALATGFILIRLLGTRWSMLALIGAALAVGLAAFFRAKPGRYWMTVAVAASLMVVLLGAAMPDPFWTVAKRKIYISEEVASNTDLYYHHEGISATTTAFGRRNQPLNRHLWINGVGMTILCNETKIMAHLPILLHPDPRKILVICFGMGTTLRSARAHRDLECTAVELVSEVYDCFKFFHADGPEVLADPRVRHFADDGRNFLLMRDETYDVISIDPAPPLWSSGTVNLYTREFFALCRNRLTPKGILCLWIPTAESTEVRMIMSTFYNVFPATLVFGGLSNPGFFMLGLNDQSQVIRPDTIQLRLRRGNSNPAVVADLNEWNRGTGGLIMPEFMGQLLLLPPRGLADFTREVPVITDDRPYTEFPVWRQLRIPGFAKMLDAEEVMLWRNSFYGLK